MLQRIQSVYLLIASIASGALFQFDIWKVKAKLLGITVKRLNGMQHLGLSISAGLMVVLLLIAIFLYKNRKRQIKFCNYAIYALLIHIGFILYISIMSGGPKWVLELVKVAPGYGAILPFIIVLFIILAKKAIKKDDKLVRSMDRLR